MLKECEIKPKRQNIAKEAKHDREETCMIAKIHE
jgi:hypothetical protein